MSTQAKPTEGTNNSFWGNVSSGFGQGLGSIGSNILPVWTAQQLGTQQEDQLRRSTFNPSTAPPRNNQSQPTTSGPAQTNYQQAQPRDVGVSGQFNVDFWTTLGLAAVGIVGVILIVKAA